ncbi:MAG: hypothetical protein ACTHQQ_24600 [Solirubrobacteraceae bacterium]
MARPTVSVGLYIDQTSDPISGSLVYPDGRRLPFAGWIELTAALEEARHFEPLDVVAHGKQSIAPRAVTELRRETHEDAAEPRGQPGGDLQEDVAEPRDERQ